MERLMPNQAAASVRAAEERAWPFAHWVLDDVLPPPVCAALLAWDPGRMPMAAIPAAGAMPATAGVSS
jgi:hypothetical protein